jgi:hypothetical protein
MRKAWIFPLTFLFRSLTIKILTTLLWHGKLWFFPVQAWMTQERQNMQANSKMHRMVLTALFAAGLATLSAQAYTVYPADTFSSAPGVTGDGSSFLVGSANRTYNPLIDQPWIGPDYGTATFLSTASVSWASGAAYDAGGNPSSGSVKLNWNWNDTADGAGSAAFVIDMYPSGQLLLAPAILSFDMMVDPSSTPGMYNDYGYFQVFTRNNGYSLDSGWVNSGMVGGAMTPATTGVWSHISIALPAGTNVRALEIQDYSGRNIVGPETLYIDNLQLQVPEPSTIALLLAGGALLAAVRRTRSA